MTITKLNNNKLGDDLHDRIEKQHQLDGIKLHTMTIEVFSYFYCPKFKRIVTASEGSLSLSFKERDVTGTRRVPCH